MLNLKRAQKNGVADTINYANLEHHPQEIDRSPTQKFEK